MSDEIKLLEVVALISDLPERGLRRGQVGTVVELLSTDAYEVEFADNQGRTYATTPLRANEIIVLHYEPVSAEP